MTVISIHIPELKDIWMKASEKPGSRVMLQRCSAAEDICVIFMSRNQVVRGNAERNAINAPLQGTAADIIKIAMVRIHEKMKSEKYASKMILQVHDELIFEVVPEELEKLKEMVIHEMTNAVKLDIP